MYMLHAAAGAAISEEGDVSRGNARDETHSGISTGETGKSDEEQ